jgi:hypothetical protein
VLEKLAKEHSALELQLQSRLALCQTVLDQLSDYAKRFLPFLLGIVIILRGHFATSLQFAALPDRIVAAMH